MGDLVCWQTGGLDVAKFPGQQNADKQHNRYPTGRLSGMAICRMDLFAHIIHLKWERGRRQIPLSPAKLKPQTGSYQKLFNGVAATLLISGLRGHWILGGETPTSPAFRHEIDFSC